MAKVLKIAAFVLLGLLIVLAVAISFTIGWRPFIGPKARPLTDRKFEQTPERLARGEYLVEGAAGCLDCHSEHDWSAPGAPPIESRLGAGVVFPLEGLPGRIVAPNLTPDPETGAGNWSDDQIARAVREGIGHDGRALFPLMPYERFRAMSDEDLAAVIVYVRSLPPVRNPLPKTEIIFPVKYLIRAVPQPVTAPVPVPDFSTPVKRGEYLVRMADCVTCHSPMVKGQTNYAMAYGGGFHLKGPWGDVTGVNITPDPSGIPYYDEQLFLQVMRTGYVKARKLNPIMPWNNFRHLTDDDLKAIFAYVRTLAPIKHRVDNTEPPTPCKLCESTHGAGERN
jgi:mono/diheme cytochrome c family protein